jgi:hypothetical protein
MNTYTVLYMPDVLYKKGDTPEAFVCQADDEDHAIEQCNNAYPSGVWMWAEEGGVENAYKNYWLDYRYGPGV